MKEYRERVAIAALQCFDMRQLFFSLGMDLAMSDELANVWTALDDDERLELPYDILTTMRDPLAHEMHDIGMACGAAGEWLVNVNNLPTHNEALVDLPMKVKSIGNGFRKDKAPSRKQALNVMFKMCCLSAAYSTGTLQYLAQLQGYKPKQLRARYYYYNHHLYSTCHDSNIQRFAQVVEQVTGFATRLVEAPGFTTNMRVPRAARYFPFSASTQKFLRVP